MLLSLNCLPSILETFWVNYKTKYWHIDWKQAKVPSSNPKQVKRTAIFISYFNKSLSLNSRESTWTAADRRSLSIFHPTYKSAVTSTESSASIKKLQHFLVCGTMSELCNHIYQRSLCCCHLENANLLHPWSTGLLYISSCLTNIGLK